VELSVDVGLTSISSLCRLTIRRNHLTTTAQNYTFNSPHRCNWAIVITIAIAYSVEKTQRGLYFIAPDKHYPNKPTQVWTQEKTEDSCFWFLLRLPRTATTLRNSLEFKPPSPFPMGADSHRKKRTKIYHWSQEQRHPTT